MFSMGLSLVVGCPAGWWFYEVTLACFYMSTEEMSQTDAYAECHSMDAELASFADQGEMDFVTSVSSVPTSFSIRVVHGSNYCLQCFDAVGWAAGRASGL